LSIADYSCQLFRLLEYVDVPPSDFSLFQVEIMPSTSKRDVPRAKSNVPDWYRTYFLAMVENDRDRALIEIRHAHKAIQERLMELRGVPTADARELQDLASAITYLGILLVHMGDESGCMLWD
jgi:hypothetical protein